MTATTFSALGRLLLNNELIICNELHNDTSLREFKFEDDTLP